MQNGHNPIFLLFPPFSWGWIRFRLLHSDPGGGGGVVWGPGQPRPTPCVTFRLVVVPLRGLDSHPFFLSHVALGRCFLLAAAAGALAGVVSTFAEPSGWCGGAVLDVAGCAVCAPAARNSWRTGVVLVIARVV